MRIMVEAFVAWRERHRAKMESFECIAGSTGGFGGVDVADETELQRIMLEYPFALFSRMECRPVMQGDTALAQLWAAVQAMAEGRQG